MSGIHCLLFQAIQNNVESCSDITLSPSKDAPEDANPLSQFHDDFSGKYITSLADVLVDQYGTAIMRRMNTLLGRWYQSWECRKSRDAARDNRTFSSDPLRFFWLAKLYIVLHFYRHALKKDSEFAVPDPEAPSDRRNQAHLRIMSWLLRFQERQAQPASQTWAEHYLCQFTKPSPTGPDNVRTHEPIIG
jgi:hypothetical protein